MSDTHRLRPLAMSVTALALFTLALALSPAGAARAATTTVTYTLATATATPVTAACDIPPCPVISYAFAGSGTTTLATVPASGNFTWTFTPSKSSNSTSCAFTQGTGTLDVTWADLTTTEVTFSFKARDSHTWAIKGQVTAGTNTFYPPNPITPASGVAGQPGDPCTGGPVAATISLTPPSPI
jgi:hypothetical protein